MLRLSLGDWQIMKMKTMEKRRATMVVSRRCVLQMLLWTAVWLQLGMFQHQTHSYSRPERNILLWTIKSWTF